MVRTTINSDNFTERLDSMKAFFNVWNEKKNLNPPGVLNFDRSLIENFDVDKTTKRLKFADFVVKAWLSKIENISLDVFLGFNTSKDLDDFMANRSSMPKYKDRKVVAGIGFGISSNEFCSNPVLPCLASPRLAFNQSKPYQKF